MLAKKYRLKEKEVKKVLQKRKPFFSYHLIGYSMRNGLTYNRYGCIFSGKNTPGSVNRNFFRRLIYRQIHVHSGTNSDELGYDIVFCGKKGILLNYKIPTHIQSIIQDIHFILRNGTKK